VARVLKFVHVIAAIGLIGSLVAFAALALWFRRIAPNEGPTLLAATSWAFARVTLPSMALLWISGLLSLAARPAWLEAGWVWVKLVLGFALTGILFIGVWRSMETAGAPHFAWIGAAVALGLAAVACGVWRPHLWTGHRVDR
jgi:hypothetical protein